MKLNRNTAANRFERIWLLAKIEYKLRYYENKLGLFWALIKPLSQLVIYYIAFKLIIRNNIPDFAIYLFTGVIIWQFFVESSGGMIAILRTKKYLYEYSNMSKVEIYLASLISISLGFFFNLSILIVILLFSGIGIGLYALYFPLLYIILFCFCFGASLILSQIYLFAKDIKQLWPLAAQLLMWMSPLFLSYEKLIRVPFIEFFNPMFGIILNFRSILMYNEAPDFELLAINLLHAVLSISLGLFLLNKIGKRASELII